MYKCYQSRDQIRKGEWVIWRAQFPRCVPAAKVAAVGEADRHAISSHLVETVDTNQLAGRAMQAMLRWGVGAAAQHVRLLLHVTRHYA